MMGMMQMMRMMKIGLLAMLAAVTLSVQAAKAPTYRFYSTSMLSPNPQCNYAPSHIRQDGSVRIIGNQEQQFNRKYMAPGINAQVISAEALTRPSKSVTIIGGGIGVNAGSLTNGNSQNQRGINYSNGSFSLPGLTLKTSMRSTSVLASTSTTGSLTSDADETSNIHRPARIDAIEEPEGLQPIGDALWPLMLMALAYIIIKRRKKNSVPEL